MSADLVELEPVMCPLCGANDTAPEAQGPDYEHRSGGAQEFHLVRCRRCDARYLNPRPTTAMLGRLYARDSYYSRTFHTQSNPVVRYAKRRRDASRMHALTRVSRAPLSSMRVLDVGAGDGGLLDGLRAAGVPSSQLYGVEVDDAAAATLAARGYQAFAARAEDLEVGDLRFDLITMIQVIEHLAEPVRVLHHLATLLAPDGAIVLETPNLDSWERGFFADRTWGGYHFPRHWTLWNRTTLMRTLEAAGLVPVSVTTTAGAITWAWTINHLLQDAGWTRAAAAFSMQNPLALAPLWALDLLPAALGRGGNLRVIARRR